MKKLTAKLQFWMIAIATTLTYLMFAACTPTPLAALHIGTDIWLGFEPLYLARDLGYFTKTPVQSYSDKKPGKTLVDSDRTHIIAIYPVGLTFTVG